VNLTGKTGKECQYISQHICIQSIIVVDGYVQNTTTNLKGIINIHAYQQIYCEKSFKACTSIHTKHPLEQFQQKQKQAKHVSRSERANPFFLQTIQAKPNFFSINIYPLCICKGIKVVAM
jgi:hypothetical protein